MIEKIQARFKESIQLQVSCAELFPELLQQATEKIVSCLLNNKKIIVCGTGRSYSNAQLLVSHLSYRYNFARPSFPATLLHFDSVIASTIAQQNELDKLYKNQIQALAQEGDLFIVFMPTGNEQAVRNALQTANDEDLDVIVFSGQNDEQIQALLDEQDLEIAVPSDNEMRIIESHLFCLNLLCEMIDVSLFSSPQ